MPRLCNIETLFSLALLAGCATSLPQPTKQELQTQVADTERAFAKTMADRDFPAFSSFISDEAIFIQDPKSLIGKAQVTARWKLLYEKPEAPFSWEPSEVEVLDSGNLALSTGPVRDSAGKVVAQFTSIWRREAPGIWRIIFDRGSDVCDGKP